MADSNDDTKHSMSLIAHDLATTDFNERCELLDTRLKDALTKSIGEKRISDKRMERIINRFRSLIVNSFAIYTVFTILHII